MLKLEHLVKDYYTGDEIVHAIRDLSVTFRDNEFVSILGPSGCGKTTLLNIIGGLDNYNSGNLIINGRSTRDYTDKDWDTYRNHRIGFVFQSYNLIMHQTVLQNVALSMALTDVPKEEREKRAAAALEKVGLKDQLNKKPTQMSGGQMQRVAIARALVNDPEILLADEPTGALDSHTSVQIMDLLKEIAKDRLVIMVTHNPELAQSYSTRIIRLKDGEIVSDSDPAADEEEVQNARGSLKKPSMKFRTALSLSFNNLLTKKGRTLLTAFAGSIGIIGIGLIMSLSNGMQGYIDRVEQDTMTSYPISIEDNTMDMSVLMSAMMTGSDEEKQPYDGTVRSRAFADKLLGSIADTEKNNLTAFRKYLQSPEGKELKETASAIEYNYGITMHVYNEHAQGDKLVTVSPNGLMDELGMSDMISLRNQFMGGMSSSMPGSEVWKALPAEDSLRDQEYELLDGRWPESEEEVMLEVDENGEISDFTLYSLGLMNQSELVQNYKDLQAQKTDEIEPGDPVSFAADELLGMEFTLVPNSDLYRKVGDIWVDESGDEGFVADAVKEDGRTLKIAGIMKPKETSLGAPHTMGGVWYDRSLETWLRDEGKNSDIVREQMEHKDINVFTGRKFGDSTELSAADLTPEQQMVLASMSQQELMDYMASYNDAANATYDSNLAKLGIYDEDTPTSIELYADTFEDKEKIGDLITAYNEQQQAEGNDANVISYNDTVGAMMSGVSDIINIISYVLMAFVGISLVVSSIMIGIITYISVLERVKEIGILRAMGASKRDVSNVFNAETFIIGLLSGLLGVGLTVLLNIPISLVIQKVTGVAGIARMPVAGGAILVLVELVLTMVAGLIPARMAARKDPVQALRSE
ncbi:ABC transporter ATP-binding protein/permease [uncultured Faecalibaculum sp.]|uniref:ABC transporter ATP-binding protein/permease n=1 Tax=uncultured Faecalibaculum sp. TaxID=1729681 RepID=UPI00263676BC|nr:ABC transporter ATP-binding protein/permease [uncultured Faecalibaculum sp.]